MSRSYKKNPVIKDNGKSKKSQKNIANRTVRSKQKQGTDISDGNAYKKHFESYKIADYICRWTKEQAIAYYNSPNNNWAKEHFNTLDDFLKYWEQHMLKK